MDFQLVRENAWPLALLAALAWCVGCASASTADAGTFSESARPTGSSVNASATAPSATITFEPAEHTLSVLTQATLSVQITPPNSQTVTFALIGDSRDASLESLQAVTDPTGLASVLLTAPSQPTSFSVRASLDRNVVTEAHVDVEHGPTGAADVSTAYMGVRKVEQYSVTLYPEQDCASSNLNQTADGLLRVNSISLPVRVASVPLSSSLAVVVDGDELVHGCATVHPVAGQALVSVQVPVDDLPLNLTGETLNVSMTATEGVTALADGISAAIPTFVAAFLSGDHDLVQLLSAMERAATGSLNTEFADARRLGNWDAFIIEAYGETGAELLRTHLRRWLARGVETIENQPLVEAQLTLGQKGDVKPQLAPLAIAGLGAVHLLGMRSTDLALTLDPNDHLNWSSRLSVGKSSLLDALAHRAANAEVPALATVSAQLAQLLDCESFASRLDEQTVWDKSNARACSQACLATLCSLAIDAMYKKAMTPDPADDLGDFALDLNASGTVELNNQAQPVRISGAWVGALLNESSEARFSGTYESR